MIHVEQRHIDAAVFAAHSDVEHVGIALPRVTIITAAGAQTMVLGLPPPPADSDARARWFLEQLDARPRTVLALAAAGARDGDEVIMSCMARTRRDGQIWYGCLIAVGTVGEELSLIDRFILPIEFNEGRPNRLLDAIAVAPLDGDRRMDQYDA